MYCRNCSRELGDGAEMCPQCHSIPLKGNNFCQTCGFTSQSEDVICPKCGAKLNRIAEPVLLISAKSRLTTTLLAILPALVGLNGIHRFYLGKFGSGIIMLLTLGGLYIWTIIDLITALQGKMKDKEGKPITG